MSAIDTAEYHRLALIAAGVDPCDIPCILDTATWRRLMLQALYDLSQGGGGSPGYINGSVQFYADLPVTVGTPAANTAYLVRENSGVWFINRKPAGIYVRLFNNGNLNDWDYAGTFPEVNDAQYFRIYDSADPTREVAFNVSGVAAGTTRTLTVPDASGTLQLTGHASAHATTGSDPITPASIGAQYSFVTSSLNMTTDTTLSAGRTRKIYVNNYSHPATKLTLTLTGDGNINGDILVLQASTMGEDVYVKSPSFTNPIATLQKNGQSFRFIYTNTWEIDPVYNHSAQHSSGGIDELSLSASQISDSSTAGRALLVASTVENQRTALELGTLAVINDAAADGKQYARKDGAWVEVAASGSGEVRSDVSGSYTYTGLAAANTAESAASWTIRRSEFTSAGAFVSTTTATNVKWDDRLTASYS